MDSNYLERTERDFQDNIKYNSSVHELERQLGYRIGKSGKNLEQLQDELRKRDAAKAEENKRNEELKKEAIKKAYELYPTDNYKREIYIQGFLDSQKEKIPMVAKKVTFAITARVVVPANATEQEIVDKALKDLEQAYVIDFAKIENCTDIENDEKYPYGFFINEK